VPALGNELSPVVLAYLQKKFIILWTALVPQLVVTSFTFASHFAVHAFLTHSGTSFFIQHLASLHNLLYKKVSQSQSAVNIRWPPNKKIKRKGSLYGSSNLKSLLMWTAFKIHHHQNIHITVWSRASRSMGTKQDNTFRIEFLDNIINKIFYAIFVSYSNSVVKLKKFQF
jgi:hypothetical protein